MNTLRIFAVSLLIALLFSGIAYGQPYGIGDKIGNFQLLDGKGELFEFDKVLAQDDVKGLVFVFMATKCPGSVRSEGRYIEYASELKDKGILFVGINSGFDETVEEMNTRAGEKGFNFRVLKDWNNAIADRLDAKTTPHAFLIGKDGTMLYNGRLDDNVNRPEEVNERTILMVADEYLAGKELSVQKTKSFG